MASDHHRYRADEAKALTGEAARNKLALLTTEKDAARMQRDGALADLASRTRALPVSLTVRESADFRQLVLGACKRA